MAGGNWTIQNKLRPGAYINFESVPAPTSNVGARGIVTFPTAMNWGPEKQLIQLYSTDLLDGSSVAKVGCTAMDAQSLIFREALSNAYLALVYRIDSGGEKASVTIGNLIATAKHTGELGNRLSVSIVANQADERKLDVITYLSGSERDRQTVSDSGVELVPNDFVVLECAKESTLEPTANTPLEGGKNGTIEPQDYTDYFNTIDQERWNTMAIPSEDAKVKEAAAAYIKNKRDNTGRKCQAVLVDYATANHESVISVHQGYVNLAGEEITPPLFAVTVAGMTAAANINQSNTFRYIENADRIINPIQDQDVEAALQAGKFLLTRRQDGGVVVEQDINTYHRFILQKDYAFSKNRVVRVLDDIGNQVMTRFENSYIGKVDNNATGRAVLRVDIIGYLSELQTMGAIQNFNSETDVQVAQGKSIDTVIADLWVQPVDAMEKLYLQVYVSATERSVN